MVTDVTHTVAQMRERLRAGKAQSAVLRERLRTPVEAQTHFADTSTVFAHIGLPGAGHDNEKLNALLAALFKNKPVDVTLAAYESPSPPVGTPVARMKEALYTV